MIEFKGAKWQKCDFHLHTPASNCFRNRTVTAEQWVDKCLDQQLDCVAVTDHNTGAWVDKIKDAAQDKGLVVFPGVELTCDTSKVHILVLFDVDKNTQDVEDFIIKCGIERKDFATSDASSPKSCMDIIQLAHDCGGLAIPAHIDEFNGLGLLSKKVISEIFSLDILNGAQFVFSEFTQPGLKIEDICQSYNARYGRNAGDIGNEQIKQYYQCVQEAIKKNVALLTFSDNPDESNPSKHGLDGIGSAYTWIKMSQNPSLESIHQALLFPERIKNCFVSKFYPYMEPSLWIQSIDVKNTKLTKNDESFHVDFNPQLTTIIGGRGSGKSSVFRFLRGVLHLTKDIDQLGEIKSDQSRFFQKDKDGTGVLKDDTEINVKIVRDGILYKIHYRYEGESLEIFKYESDDWVPIEDSNFLDFFVLEQYSQKQIFEMAKKTNTLKNLIDHGSDEIQRLTTEIKENKNQYLTAKAQLKQNLTAKEQIGKLNTEIEDLNSKINSFKASNITEIADKQEKFIKHYQLIDDHLGELSRRIDAIIKALTLLTNSKSELDLSDMAVRYRAEIEKMLAPLYEQVNSVVGGTNEKLKALQADIIRTFSSFQENTSFMKDKNTCHEIFEKRRDELEKNGINDFSNYNKYLELLRTKESQKEELQKIAETLPDLKEKIIQLRDAIYNRMAERTLSRRGSVDKCNTPKVRIDIVQLSDKKQFIANFRRIIQKDKGYDKALQKIEAICFPQRPGNFKELYRSILDDFQRIRKGENSVFDFDGTFSNMIKSLTDEQISRLEVLVPGDMIDVKYKPNGNSNFKSIVNASAGQKTTAVLTFILSQAGCPLLLDQPEDDLDNRLVCDLVVEKIKAIKEKRQVIVITHNANIPVIGDSEYIITMDSNSRFLKEHSEGMVEDAVVRNDICEIMEGGEDAFNKRAIRYKQLKH